VFRAPDHTPRYLKFFSTPAALAVSALMVPFVPDPKEAGKLVLADPPTSMMEAIVRGTNDGIGFVASIIAMLMVLVALVSVVNLALGHLPHGGEPVTLQGLLAYLFWPLLWVIGIPASERGAASHLMATKTVLNEFVAYLDLAQLSPGTLSACSKLILTDALCGFANFGSLGILVGGLTAMAPARRHEIVALAPRSILSGTLATLMSGALVGLITG